MYMNSRAQACGHHDRPSYGQKEGNTMMSTRYSWQTAADRIEIEWKIANDRVKEAARKDRETVAAILDGRNLEERPLTDAEQLQLAQIVMHGVTFHKTGKIGGAWSVDGSATSCGFCKRMRAAAGLDPDIICGSCYDAAMEESYRAASVQPRHELTQAVVRSVLFTVNEWKTILARVPLFTLLRFNSSGDLDSVTEARNHIRAAAARPDLHAAQWTKNDPVWRRAVDLESGRPGNLRAVRSTCRIDGKAPAVDPRYYDTAFTVRRDAGEYIAASGANACNGKACQACGWKCYLTEQDGGWTAGTETAEQLRKR